MSVHSLALIDQLAPVLERVAALPLDQCTEPEAAQHLATELERDFPFEGPVVQSIGTVLRTGVQSGGLCERGEPSARFGRVSKAIAPTHHLSIDLVSLRGPGQRHGHPRGEVTLAFVADPAHRGARFDGYPPGWIVSPVGSVHTPTVTGPRMLLLYFLPGGAADWNPPGPKNAPSAGPSL